MADFQPTCFTLIGPPGSGKSTWCEKNLSWMREPAVISSDVVMLRIAQELGVTYEEAVQLTDYDKDIVHKLEQEVAAASVARRDIVFDLTNRNLKERVRYRHLIPVNYHFVGVVFEFDEAEIRQRVKDRAERSGKVIPDAAMAMHLREYTPPNIFEFNQIIRVPRS